MYYDLRDYTKSEEYYLGALENYSQLFQPDSNAYREDLAVIDYRLASLYEVLHDYTKSEKYYILALYNYNQLFKMEPNIYQHNLALTQKRLADLYDNENKDKAKEYYLKALENYNNLYEKSPDSYRISLALVQYNLLYIYEKDSLNLKQYDMILDSALSNFELLYAEGNNCESIIVDLRNRKGWRLLSKGETDRALQFFESTYKLNPEKTASYMASGYNAKAYDLAKAMDYAKAIETIDKAISLKPEIANYYDSKGEFLLMKGDEKGALEMWHKVIELDPNFLKKYEDEGGTDFYKQLIEKKLISN